MTFSEKLIKLRKSAGLTQQEAAEGAGLSLRGYQNYEHGLREPKIPILIALADFYDVSLDELVCRERPKEPEA
jgi:transcriptional regulator with XRE-family HTH domain